MVRSSVGEVTPALLISMSIRSVTRPTASAARQTESTSVTSRGTRCSCPSNRSARAPKALANQAGTVPQRRATLW